MNTLEFDTTRISPDVQQVLGNHLLAQRASRIPDYQAEVEATSVVIKTLRESPESVLTTLSLAVKDLTGADSAGVSLSGRDNGTQILLWQAAVGLFDKYLGSVVKHDESPCGLVLESDATILMLQPGRAYRTAAGVEPPIREVLLVPFHVQGRTVGTVWVISQSTKQFEAEDVRLVTNISELAALTYQMLIKLGDLELLSQTVQIVADQQFLQRR